MRINIPILKSPYEVYTAFIVVEDILEMVALVPVIVPLVVENQLSPAEKAISSSSTPVLPSSFLSAANPMVD